MTVLSGECTLKIWAELCSHWRLRSSSAQARLRNFWAEPRAESVWNAPLCTGQDVWVRTWCPDSDLWDGTSSWPGLLYFCPFVYTPARAALPNPQWHKICETLPLLERNPYPFWQKSTKRVPSVAQLVFKTGLLVKLLVCSTENPAILVQFLTFCTLPGTTTGKTIRSLAYMWCSKPYPWWQIAWKPYPLWSWN